MEALYCDMYRIEVYLNCCSLSDKPHQASNQMSSKQQNQQHTFHCAPCDSSGYSSGSTFYKQKNSKPKIHRKNIQDQICRVNITVI